MDKMKQARYFFGRYSRTGDFAAGHRVDIEVVSPTCKKFIARTVKYDSLCGCYVVINGSKYTLQRGTHELKEYFI